MGNLSLQFVNLLLSGDVLDWLNWLHNRLGVGYRLLHLRLGVVDGLLHLRLSVNRLSHGRILAGHIDLVSLRVILTLGFLAAADTGHDTADDSQEKNTNGCDD